eukprot:gene18067-biopygen8377
MGSSPYTWHGTAYRRIKGTAARPLPFLTAASAAAWAREVRAREHAPRPEGARGARPAEPAQRGQGPDPQPI